MFGPLAPTLTVFAGPNGAGKTTLMRWLAESRLEFPNHHNADDLAASRKSAGVPKSATGPSRRALMDQRQSLGYETVLASSSHVAKLQQARDAGYHVRLIYVGLEAVDLSMARVADRVAKGGHAVPDAKLRSNFAGSMACLAGAIMAANESLIFDNSREAVKGPQRVAHVMGRYVRVWETEAISWPETWLFSRLRADPCFTFAP